LQHFEELMRTIKQREEELIVKEKIIIEKQLIINTMTQKNLEMQ